MDWYLDLLYFPNTNLSFPPNQVCTAVTVQRLPTARWLAGESFAPWTQSTRSWRDWSRNVAHSLSLKNPCGSVFWAVHTLLLHQKRRRPIQPRWTVPSCTAAPRLTPHSAGRLCLYGNQWCYVNWFEAEHRLFLGITQTLLSTGTCVRRSAPTGGVRRGKTSTSSASTTQLRQNWSTA